MQVVLDVVTVYKVTDASGVHEFADFAAALEYLRSLFTPATEPVTPDPLGG